MSSKDLLCLSDDEEWDCEASGSGSRSTSHGKRPSKTQASVTTIPKKKRATAALPVQDIPTIIQAVIDSLPSTSTQRHSMGDEDGTPSSVEGKQCLLNKLITKLYVHLNNCYPTVQSGYCYVNPQPLPHPSYVVKHFQLTISSPVRYIRYSLITYRCDSCNIYL